MTMRDKDKVDLPVFWRDERLGELLNTSHRQVPPA